MEINAYLAYKNNLVFYVDLKKINLKYLSNY